MATADQQASEVPITDSGDCYTGTEVEAALQEIAGAGRTTETVKQNADDISNVGVWTDWTPTWTNLTVGNATVVARFVRIGNLVKFQIALTFGSTTSISGNVIFTLPATALATAMLDNSPLGVTTFLDSGTDSIFGYTSYHSTTQGKVLVADNTGTYPVQTILSSTVPFTWTTSDEIRIEGSYEAS